MQNAVTLSPSLYSQAALMALDHYLGQKRHGKKYRTCDDAFASIREAVARKSASMQAFEVINRIQSGLPGESVALLQDLLEIRHKDMARILSREDKTIRLWSKRQTLSSSASEQVFRLMKVYLAACSVFENGEEALSWLKEPSEPLGGHAPLELLATSEGERIVIDELMQMEYAHPVFAGEIPLLALICWHYSWYRWDWSRI